MLALHKGQITKVFSSNFRASFLMKLRKPYGLNVAFFFGTHFFQLVELTDIPSLVNGIKHL